MTETIEQLKPCPFCGGSNIRVRSTFVCCIDCRADGPLGGTGKPFCRDLWNTRASDHQLAQSQAEVANLREASRMAEELLGQCAAAWNAVECHFQDNAKVLAVMSKHDPNSGGMIAMWRASWEHEADKAALAPDARTTAGENRDTVHLTPEQRSVMHKALRRSCTIVDEAPTPPANEFRAVLRWKDGVLFIGPFAAGYITCAGSEWWFSSLYVNRPSFRVFVDCQRDAEAAVRALAGDGE